MAKAAFPLLTLTTTCTGMVITMGRPSTTHMAWRSALVVAVASTVAVAVAAAVRAAAGFMAEAVTAAEAVEGTLAAAVATAEDATKL
jgi:hypothetical protein